MSSVQQKYQKKTQLEHILDIPDTYIGSIDKTNEEMYVYDDTTKKITKKNIEYIDGLQRIYEEIILNAFDQTVRDGTGTSVIKVEINKEEGTISVFNNGQGIPVIMHEKEQVWIPEMIFGQLLTSSNYDKKQKRITGGKNGYGSKLANIFSTSFTLETVDETTGQKFKMTWSDNMKKKTKAKITSFKSKPYTKVTFTPDFKRFNLDGLTDDIISLMKKRVYDIAVNTHKGIVVWYNGEKIPIKKFEDYVKMYLPEGDSRTILTDETQDRWSVAVMLNEDNFEQVSFVNGINTTNGGNHVKHVSDQMIKTISDKISKGKDKMTVNNKFIKDKLFVFVKSFIENPSFNSQTKKEMTSKAKSFGSVYTLPTTLEKKILKIGILEEVMSFAKFKDSKKLKKTDGKKTKRITIPKLEDANWAGTAKSNQCRLILTEGDSAKTFAISGLSKIGRDKFGIFPLKGKLLNVRDQSSDKILNNAEITNMKKIIGLKQGTTYKDTSTLRYGGIIILTDQDVDGSHIKGLVMNMFHAFWPELIGMDFIQSMATPIIKAFKGKQEVSFFTLTDYEDWKKTHKGWSIKYYKGLGTSNSREAKECFTDFEQKIVYYNQCPETDAKINLAFKKDKADARKDWLMKYDRSQVIDQKERKVDISDFIDKDLIHFSSYDNHRSIPSIVDGFKPTQRKVLFAAMKRNKIKKTEIKVAQFSGYVSEKTDYHHGEASIVGTIINMAQNFVGSNNCNLLMPNGQFGTRIMGGKDSSSERYIFTNISNIAHHIFNESDNPLLNFIDSEGTMVEPEYYVPTIPMILINGSLGIGTGFSTNVLPHKLEDIIENIKLKLKGDEIKPLKPYYRNFSGNIIADGKGKWKSVGKWEIKEDSHSILVTELPVGTWTENYKQFLEKITINKTATKTESRKQLLEYFETQCTEMLVSFELFFNDKNFIKVKKDVEKHLKLSCNISENNMYLHDKDHNIRKFKTCDEILDYWFDIRREYYQKRKDNLIADLERRTEVLKNIVRFIEMSNKEEIKILRVTKDNMIKQLVKHKFLKVDGTYDYLIRIPIYMLTDENAEKKRQEYLALSKELEALRQKTVKQFWLYDLDKISKENTRYNTDLEDLITEDMNEAATNVKPKKKKRRIVRKTKAKKVKKKIVKKRIVRKKKE